MRLINEHGDRRPGGARRVGIPGDERGLFTGERRTDLDLGLVGDVDEVHPEAVLEAIAAGRIPVISSLALERGTGQVLNVNADSAAASLAVALGAAKLVVLTDVAGLYRDWPNRDSLVSHIDVRRARGAAARRSSRA